MKHTPFYFIVYTASKFLQAQSKEPWISFYDSKSKKMGFKDLKDNIKYLDVCGEHNTDIYPLFTAIISYYKKRNKPLINLKDISEFNRQYEIDY